MYPLKQPSAGEIFQLTALKNDVMFTGELMLPTIIKKKQNNTLDSPFLLLTSLKRDVSSKNKINLS